ncbi:MAG: hypothetical protein OWQ54_05925 [Sulfolobaceae archaeon]|nr:hypothetical protein [Sulfolobaceae archaeon]
MYHRKREQLEIIYDILRSVERGAKKTQIMYNASLNYFMINKYLKLLQDKQLIVKKDELYVLTVKGREVLDTLRKYKELKEQYIKILESLKDFK